MIMEFYFNYFDKKKANQGSIFVFSFLRSIHKELVIQPEFGYGAKRCLRR